MRTKWIALLAIVTVLLTGCGQKQDELVKVTLDDGRNIEAEDSIFDFAIDEKNLYYQGQKGEIYKRPLSDWDNDAKRETLAQVPYEDMYYTGYPYASIYEENGSVFYRYHSGGATMGGNYLYRITDGKEPQCILNQNYDSYTEFNKFGIRTLGPAVGSVGLGMAHVNKDGSQEYIGPEWHQYYVQADSYDAKRKVLYLAAREYNNDTNRLTQGALYEFHLNDEELVKLTDSAYENYDVTKDAIYYQALQKLFMLDLNTKEESVIVSSADFVYLYAAVENGVFYACAENQNGLSFWNKENEQTTQINTGAVVTQLYGQNGYAVAHFDTASENQHSMMVFDAKGNPIFSTTDMADKAVINKDGVMVYRLAGTAQLVKVQL